MKTIIVVVGHSGAGKSTFIKAMGLDDCVYVTSQPLINELRRCDSLINHDTIFALSQDWYRQRPDWQIEQILTELGERNILIVDGPRYADEIRQLRTMSNIHTIVIAVTSTSEVRFERLKRRGKISLATSEEFTRLEQDEQSMEIDELIAMADFVILNGESGEKFIAKLQEEGRLIGLLLKKLF